MAEGFAIATGVISVASFAIQLAETVQKACDFWESVEEAPDDINRLTRELKLLTIILKSISRELTSGGTNTAQDSLVMDVLKMANEDINELYILATQLASKIDPARGKMKRKWGQIRIVLKADKIKKMKGHVESAKSTLNVIQLSRIQVTTSQNNGHLELLSSSLSVGVQALPRIAAHSRYVDDPGLDTRPPREDGEYQSYSDSLAAAAVQCSPTTSSLQARTKSTWTSINAGLALLSFQSYATTFHDLEKNQDHEENAIPTKKTFTINFLWGYSSCRRGFRLSTHNRFDSLTLNCVRRRPTDDLIFGLCWKGDTMEVQKLLQTKEASLFDTDEYGRNLLQYACRRGHSGLAVMLLQSGIDYYMRSDNGRTAMDELRTYDKSKRWENRHQITRITETLVQETEFDPLNVPFFAYKTLTLQYGLPYEVLKYLLSQDDRVISTSDKYKIVVENLLRIGGNVDDFERCMNLLLTKYESMRQLESQNTTYQWPLEGTLLQNLIADWILEPITGGLEGEMKICRCLSLTWDLYALDRVGTCLNVIATADQEWIQPWLELLARSGADVVGYLDFESEQHPDGILYQAQWQCCRRISLNFQGSDEGYTGVEVENVCLPEYEHFHPDYRCEARRRRERCITQMHDVIIDEDGRPKQNIPGGWSGTLRPNSEVYLVLRNMAYGKEYVETLKEADRVWNEDSGEWEYFDGLDLIAENRSRS